MGHKDDGNIKWLENYESGNGLKVLHVYYKRTQDWKYY